MKPLISVKGPYVCSLQYSHTVLVSAVISDYSLGVRVLTSGTATCKVQGRSRCVPGFCPVWPDEAIPEGLRWLVNTTDNPSTHSSGVK